MVEAELHFFQVEIEVSVADTLLTLELGLCIPQKFSAKYLTSLLSRRFVSLLFLTKRWGTPIAYFSFALLDKLLYFCITTDAAQPINWHKVFVTRSMNLAKAKHDFIKVRWKQENPLPKPTA